MRLLTSLLLVFLVVAAPAQAKSKRAAARLIACDDKERSASFQGDMRAFGRAVGLSMRFTLQARDADEGWAPVDAEGFDVWLTAEPGVSRYVYDKAVDGLAPGADYRAVVRFRWRSAKGRVVAREVRHSRPCRQPDTRAELAPLDVELRDGSPEAGARYAVTVANTGTSAAAPFVVALAVDGGDEFEGATQEPLAPGKETVVEIVAPRCTPGSELVATVDADGDVDETDETNNVIMVTCPAGRPSR